MTPKCKEFEIAHSLHLMQMLNCLLLIFQILQDGYENFKFVLKIFKK